MKRLFAQKQVAVLFSAVESPATAQVIEWPQKSGGSHEPRGKADAGGKSQPEKKYASK